MRYSSWDPLETKRPSVAGFALVEPDFAGGAGLWALRKVKAPQTAIPLMTAQRIAPALRARAMRSSPRNVDMCHLDSLNPWPEAATVFVRGRQRGAARELP